MLCIYVVVGQDPFLRPENVTTCDVAHPGTTAPRPWTQQHGHEKLTAHVAQVKGRLCRWKGGVDITETKLVASPWRFARCVCLLNCSGFSDSPVGFSFAYQTYDPKRKKSINSPTQSASPVVQWPLKFHSWTWAAEPPGRAPPTTAPPESSKNHGEQRDRWLQSKPPAAWSSFAPDRKGIGWMLADAGSPLDQSPVDQTEWVESNKKLIKGQNKLFWINCFKWKFDCSLKHI